MPEMSTLTMNNTTYEVVDNNHRNDKNNPHGITPEQIGAAPSGFGLGAQATNITDDLNNVVTNGWYCYNSGVCTNVPEDKPSLLFVESFYNTNYCKQTATIISTGKIYTRMRNSGYWYPWKEVYTSENKPTPAEIGAMATGGGTMSGEINMGGNRISNIANPAQNADAVNLAMLNSIGLPSRGVVTETTQNEATEQGIYIVDGWGDYCLMFVFVSSWGKVQVLLPYHMSYFAVRMYWGAGWREWKTYYSGN